jgi:hypothetical protein
MTGQLLARAGAGDGDAFAKLVEPYRHELQVHCCRILGSIQDAGDVPQETLMAAWRGLDQFEERGPVRLDETAPIARAHGCSCSPSPAGTSWRSPASSTTGRVNSVTDVAARAAGLSECRARLRRPGAADLADGHSST